MTVTVKYGGLELDFDTEEEAREYIEQVKRSPYIDKNKLSMEGEDE